MKIAYIAHPIGGDVVGNTTRVSQIVKSINENEPETVPFAPYISDVLALNDADPEQRKRGFKNNIEILRRGVVDEVRLYGPTISPGMAVEIREAIKNNITVVPMTDKLQELYNIMLKSILEFSEYEKGKEPSNEKTNVTC